MTNKLKLILTLPLATLFLSACSLSPVKSNPANTYTLNALNTPVKTTKQTQATLMVSMPQANPGYTSEQMIYVRTPHQLNAFSKNRWTATPAAMLLPLITQSLQQTDAFKAVIASPYPGITDYRLDTRILKLQQSFLSSPSEIELSVQAQLISNQSGKIVASKTFNITEATTANNPYGGVVAANAAVKKLLNELNHFVVATRDH